MARVISVEIIYSNRFYDSGTNFCPFLFPAPVLTDSSTQAMSLFLLQHSNQSHAGENAILVTGLLMEGETLSNLGAIDSLKRDCCCYSCLSL